MLAWDHAELMVSPTSDGFCLYKKKRRIERHREEYHVTMEAEIRVIAAATRETSGVARSHQKLEEMRKTGDFKGNVAQPVPYFGPLAPRTVRE